MKKTIVLTALFAMLAMLPATVMAKGLMEALGDMEQATGSDINMKSPATVTPTPTLNDYSGTYYIAAGNGLVLEMTSNTNNYLRMHTFKGTRNQQFRFEKQSDGTYKIVVVGSGKVLTSFFYDAGNTDPHLFLQWDDFGSRAIPNPTSISMRSEIGRAMMTIPPTEYGASYGIDITPVQAKSMTQRWRITSVGNNEVKIDSINGNIQFGGRNANDYYFVAGSSHTLADYRYGKDYGKDTDEVYVNERITLVPVSGNTNRFIPVENGVYKIQPRYKSESGKGFLEVGGDPINGNPQLAHNFTSAGSHESNWRFERQADWTYIITHVASNRVMAVRPIIPAGAQSEGLRYQSAAVVVQPRTNTTDERWYVTNSGNGFYQFTSVKNGYTYRGQQWDGAKLISGTTDLLYGWFKLIKQ